MDNFDAVTATPGFREGASLSAPHFHFVLRNSFRSHGQGLICDPSMILEIGRVGLEIGKLAGSKGLEIESVLIQPTEFSFICRPYGDRRQSELPLGQSADQAVRQLVNELTLEIGQRAQKLRDHGAALREGFPSHQSPNSLDQEGDTSPTATNSVRTENTEGAAGTSSVMDAILRRCASDGTFNLVQEKVDGEHEIVTPELSLIPRPEKATSLHMSVTGVVTGRNGDRSIIDGRYLLPQAAGVFEIGATVSWESASAVYAKHTIRIIEEQLVLDLQ